jgi:hypothetical protein
MPPIRFRRAAIKKYLDAFEAESLAFEAARARAGPYSEVVLPSGMRYTPYPETDSGMPDQVVDNVGANIYGPFLTQYFAYDASGSATMYDDVLKSLTQNGAFVSRFQTIKFRQFDEALHAMQAQFLPMPFNESAEWLNVVTNTTYILENFNTRLNLMNAGMQGIFQSSVYTPNTTTALDYLSNTDWHNSTWTDLPLPLITSDSNNFMSATFYDDANVIPLESISPYTPTYAAVTVAQSSFDTLFQFDSTSNNVLIVSVTNDLTSEINSAVFTRAGHQPFNLTGDTTITVGSGGDGGIVITTGTSALTFSGSPIDTNFVVQMTVTDGYVAATDTMYVNLSLTAGPAYASVTPTALETQTEFSVMHESKTNVLIVSVTNTLSEYLTGIEFSRLDVGMYDSFLLSGNSTFTSGGQATSVAAPTSHDLTFDSTTADFVMEMTLTDGYMGVNSEQM